MMQDGYDIVLGASLVVLLFITGWGGFHAGYHSAQEQAIDAPHYFVKEALKACPEKALELERGLTSSKGSVEIQ